MTYHKHDDEFIRETIKLMETSKKSVAAIGRDLGISSSTLYAWRDRKGEIEEKGREVDPPRLTETEEVRELRRKLRDAEMERDILKKAVAVFSKYQK